MGWGSLLLVVMFTPVTRWWAEWLAGRWDEPRADVLVVLGGDSMGPGQLGYGSFYRSYCAVRVWPDSGAKRIIILGNEASGPMRDYLRTHGVPGGVIETEDISRSTEQNIRQAKRLLAGEAGSVAVLSSDYHMRRTALLLEKAGIRARTVPCPDALKRAAHSYVDRWSVAGILAWESLKLAGVQLRPPQFE